MIKHNQALTFDISTLMDVGTGTRELYSFEGPVSFDDINVKSNIKGKMEIMRLEEGVNARMENVEIVVGLQCTKCLKEFNQKIKIDNEERIFLFDPPPKQDDPNDVFLIDKKKQRIEVTEPLRQEIILHFPSIPVCYTSCKGIEHKCSINEEEEYKPLAALKDLLK